MEPRQCKNEVHLPIKSAPTPSHKTKKRKKRKEMKCFSNIYPLFSPQRQHRIKMTPYSKVILLKQS